MMSTLKESVCLHILKKRLIKVINQLILQRLKQDLSYCTKSSQFGLKNLQSSTQEFSYYALSDVFNYFHKVLNSTQNCAGASEITKIERPEFMYAMSLSLIQYLLRVIRTYYLFTQATGVSGILAEAPWAIVGFNILLYMQGGHVSYYIWPFTQFNS